MSSLCTWDAGGSTDVAPVAPSRGAASAAAAAAALDGSTLSVGSFGPPFFSGMISSSDNHGECQCYSRPQPSNTGLPHERMDGTNRQKEHKMNEVYIIDSMSHSSSSLQSPPGGFLYTLVGFSWT